MTKICGVFEGGGVKGTALVGAVTAFEENGYEFQAVAGASAGAIIASLLAVGYTADELKTILMKKDFKDFEDSVSSLPGYKWYAAYKKMGMYKGDEFRRWINELLEKKLNKRQPTMADLSMPLTIVATNVYRRRIDWFKGPANAEDSQYLETPIADAVRASMSIPGFFVPYKWNGSLFVDGGVLCNFPVFAFRKELNEKSVPVVGFRLDSGDPTKDVDDTVALVMSIIETVVAHNSPDDLPDDKIIRLSSFGVGTTDFDISQEKKMELYDFAKLSSETWLSTHDLLPAP